jgi:hypothetical protein
MRKLKRSRIAQLVQVAMLVLGCPLFAQQFVDAPEPKSAAGPANMFFIQPEAHPTHHFLDRQNLIMFSVATALRTADSAYTCSVGVGTTDHNADGSITVHREDSLPVNSCHGVVLMNYAFAAMGLGGSYLLHRMGHHKLERVPSWIVASVPVFGIAYTATHQHEHLAR